MAEKLTTGFSRKLGLTKRRRGDESLIRDLLSSMEADKADFTATFQALTRKAAGYSAPFPLPEDSWLQRWLQRIKDETSPADMMKASNPRIHPRNRPVQATLDAAEQGDLQAFHRIMSALSDPWNYGSALPELEPEETTESRPFKTYCGT